MTLSCTELISALDLFRKSTACSLKVPLSPMKSKNNFSLRGYCLLDSEDLSAYMNESKGALVVPNCCINELNSVYYILESGW
jgi:hypothetical protein